VRSLTTRPAAIPAFEYPRTRHLELATRQPVELRLRCGLPAELSISRRLTQGAKREAPSATIPIVATSCCSTASSSRRPGSPRRSAPRLSRSSCSCAPWYRPHGHRPRLQSASRSFRGAFCVGGGTRAADLSCVALEGVKPDNRQRATRCDLRRRCEQHRRRRNRSYAAASSSPLTDSNRRPLLSMEGIAVARVTLSSTSLLLIPR